MGDPRPNADPLAAADEASAEEARLVERVRQGDAGEYGELVRRHMRRAFSVAYRLLQHREDAEDLVQEAFMVALEKIDTFEPGRPFGPWFYRLLVNRGLNQRKARALRATEPLPPDVVPPGAEALHGAAEPPCLAAERARLRERLAAAVGSLPKRQRTVVRLFELEGFSGVEIAAMLDVSPATVRWHLHEARKALREALAPAEEEKDDA